MVPGKMQRPKKGFGITVPVETSRSPVKNQKKMSKKETTSINVSIADPSKSKIFEKLLVGTHRM